VLAIAVRKLRERAGLPEGEPPIREDADWNETARNLLGWAFALARENRLTAEQEEKAIDMLPRLMAFECACGARVGLSPSCGSCFRPMRPV